MIKKIFFKILSILFSQKYVKVMKKTGPIFRENQFYILILFHLSLFIFLLDLASAYLLASLINKDLTKELFVLNMVHDSEPTVIIVVVLIFIEISV